MDAESIRTVAVLGNCQSSPISSILNFSCLGVKFARYTKLAHHLTFDDYDDIHSFLNSQDAIIIQYFQSSLFEGLSLTPLELRNKYPNKPIIVFPNIFSTIVHPFVLVGKSSVMFREAHGLAILPYTDFSEIFSSISCSLLRSDLFSLKSYVNGSLVELKSREELCTVGISSFVRLNAFRQKLFHTPNHPTNMLYKSVASSIVFKLFSSISLASKVDTRFGEYSNEDYIAPKGLVIENFSFPIEKDDNKFVLATGSGVDFNSALEFFLCHCKNHYLVQSIKDLPLH